ncbi:MAG: CHAD domain-containing protein [Planctomycetes bacterium]|nr:CHAD domain-containing protein [Planctomycetota bacterium]
MAGGKWISDLTATTPLADAARRVLTVRLELVRDFLPLALRDWDKDPEHVHQLRVSTRRARAALDIFASCLPPREYRAARKLLRRVRRAAGEARDWDVFLASLNGEEPRPSPRHRAGRDFLLSYAFAHRLLAQTHLEETSRLYPFSFDRFLAETVAAVHAPLAAGRRTLIDLALPMLSSLVGELERAAAGDLNDYQHLHQVRIFGKRLRYAMEVFADCFDPSFREQLYPAVEEMQDILGRANDSHVAVVRLEALAAHLEILLPRQWKRFKPGIMGWLRFHEGRLVQEQQHFRKWWRHWQKSGGNAAFGELLKMREGPAA